MSFFTHHQPSQTTYTPIQYTHLQTNTHSHIPLPLPFHPQVQAREPIVSSSTSTTPTSNPPSSPPAAQPPVVAPVIPQAALLPASFFQSLPWSRSINGDGPETLLYMPFLEAQMRHLEAHGGFVRDLPIPESVSYTRAAKKASHMGKSKREK